MKRVSSVQTVRPLLQGLFFTQNACTPVFIRDTLRLLLWKVTKRGLTHASGPSGSSTGCSSKSFFFTPLDRTPRVSSALESVAGERRHHTVTPPVVVLACQRGTKVVNDKVVGPRSLMNESLPQGLTGANYLSLVWVRSGVLPPLGELLLTKDIAGGCATGHQMI